MPCGKKQCPECQVFVGPRLKVCACGHRFAFRPPPTKSKATTVKKSSRVSARRKALNPPIDPRDLSRKSLGRQRALDNLDEKPPVLIGVSDRVDLQEFIEGLKSAYTRSQRSGGQYSAFLRHKTGVLRVEVDLTWKLK